MYYIGYILGIVLILWLIITLVKALSGKKDKGSDAGPSSADYPSAGGSAGSEGSGIRTAVPGKGSEGGSMPSGEMPSGPMPSAGPAGYRPKEDAWRETERSETEPAGLSEEIYMKAPSDIDLPKTSIYEKERGASLERSSRVREESSGTHSSGKEKTSGPVVRAGRDETDEDYEKKTVILYREDTGKYRKRCPFCNTYLTSGNTFCEVCGSKVSA